MMNNAPAATSGISIGNTSSVRRAASSRVPCRSASANSSASTTEGTTVKAA